MCSSRRPEPNSPQLHKGVALFRKAQQQRNGSATPRFPAIDMYKSSSSKYLSKVEVGRVVVVSLYRCAVALFWGGTYAWAFLEREGGECERGIYIYASLQKSATAQRQHLSFFAEKVYRVALGSKKAQRVAQRSVRRPGQ